MIESGSGQTRQGGHMTESDGQPLAELTGPDKIANLADPATIRAGSTLANAESVELLEVTPLTVRARVHDHDGDIDVRLGSSQSGLKTWCSCGAEGTLCRHAVATALTAWQRVRHGGG
jgi:uncharacterized Zn finger protein